MPISKQHALTHEGKEVFTFTLTNVRGTKLSLTNYGGIVMALTLTLRDGSAKDVVLGFDGPEGYLSPAYRGLKASPYFGAIIGRTTNRIARGRFRLDDLSYSLAQNLPPE